MIKTRHGTKVVAIDWVNTRTRTLKCTIEFAPGHQELRYYPFNYLVATDGDGELIAAAIERRDD